MSTSFMPKQQLNPPQQAARLSSQKSCSIFNNELMWLWPLTLSLGKNNALLINRCMQIRGTSKAKMEPGAALQTEEVGPRQSGGVVGGGRGMAGDPRFCFNRTDNQPGSFEKAPVACSSVNGLSIVPEYGWKDKKIKNKKSHITLITTPVPDGATGNHFPNETQCSLCAQLQWDRAECLRCFGLTDF